MDILTLASGIIATTNKKNADALMPDQQKTRPYKSIEKSTQEIKVEPTLIRQFVGEMKDEWIQQYIVQWPLGQLGIESRKNATLKDMEDLANNWAMKRSFAHLGDDKYILVKKATTSQITYVFNVDRWIKDNFSSLRPRFKPPLTLLFEYKNNPPTFFTTMAPYMDLQKFCGLKFKEFLKSKPNILKHPEFAFIQKITADLFEYEIDMQLASVKATLKYSVVMASLAAYMLIKHRRQFSKGELKTIQSKTRNLGNIGRLDKYLKGL